MDDFRSVSLGIIHFECTLSKSLFVAQMTGAEELGGSRLVGVELKDDDALRVFKNTIPNAHLGPKILWRIKTDKCGKTTDWPEMVKAYGTLNEILDATDGYIPLQKPLHLQFRQYLKASKLEWSKKESYVCVENLRKMLQALLKYKRDHKGQAPRRYPKLQILIDKVVMSSRYARGNDSQESMTAIDDQESMTDTDDEVASEGSSDLELAVFGSAKAGSSSHAPRVQQRSHCYTQQPTLAKVFEVFTSLQGHGQSTVPMQPQQAVPTEPTTEAIVPIQPKQAVPTDPKLEETSGAVLLTAERLAMLANPQQDTASTVEGDSPLLGKTPRQFKGLKKQTKGKATKMGGNILKRPAAKDTKKGAALTKPRADFPTIEMEDFLL